MTTHKVKSTSSGSASASTASVDWFRQRVQLFRQVQTNVESLLGKESGGLKKYRQAYDQQVKSRSWRPVKREDLIVEVDHARLVFLADFHALQQSQKAQVRILKSLNSNKKRILGVECIQAKHQKKLDMFMSGRISEDDFLQATEWASSWGFPWENYRPIFDWARKNKAEVVGLDLRVRKNKNRSKNRSKNKREVSSLKQRDQFAATIIAKKMKDHPQHQMLVVFGDLHLADPHLPTTLKKQLPELKTEEIVSIFQNSENIYFNLLKKEMEVQVDVVALRPHEFCLMSIPPWVKWQSYLLFLESQFDQALASEGTDYTDQISKYCQLIANDLNLRPDLSDISVYSAADDVVFEKINARFGGQERRWFNYLIESSRSFYCPELKTAYLGKPSVNEATSLAMTILHAKLSGRQRSLSRLPQDFNRLILSEAMNYFGSKMINPKRKTDTVTDIRASLTSRGSVRESRDALALALAQKMHELMIITSGVNSAKLPEPRLKSSYFEAARLLGGMMGERLYAGYRNKILSHATLLKILRQPLEDNLFDKFYGEILSTVEDLPEPFLSKIEKL